MVETISLITPGETATGGTLGRVTLSLCSLGEREDVAIGWSPLEWPSTRAVRCERFFTGEEKENNP